MKTLLRLNQTILETFEKLNLLNKTSYFRLITQKYDIFGFTGDFEQKSPAKKRIFQSEYSRKMFLVCWEGRRAQDGIYVFMYCTILSIEFHALLFPFDA